MPASAARAWAIAPIWVINVASALHPRALVPPRDELPGDVGDRRADPVAPDVDADDPAGPGVQLVQERGRPLATLRTPRLVHEAGTLETCERLRHRGLGQGRLTGDLRPGDRSDAQHALQHRALVDRPKQAWRARAGASGRGSLRLHPECKGNFPNYSGGCYARSADPSQDNRRNHRRRTGPDDDDAGSPAGPLIGIVRYRSEGDLSSVLGALRPAGIRSLEVTLDTPGALDAIATIAGAGGTIGAGTVLDGDQVRSSAEAGAGFVVSPGLVEDGRRRRSNWMSSRSRAC